MSAVSTAVTGLIGAAFAGIMASQAWQRWTEQRHAEAEGDGGPAEAVLTPKAAVTAVTVRAAAPQAGQARAALAIREPGWAAELNRCSSVPPRSR